ncbi:hypothetical protein ACFHWW_27410 [Ensifer sp. P24N7]|uniref:hypothetical protein n=1 Tax=Sinorhizobium sp. P24N7 TaxID=3348358 RepID=UPI0035F3FF94
MIDALDNYLNDARWDEPAANREPPLLPIAGNILLMRRGENAPCEPDDDNSFEEEMEFLREVDAMDAFVSMTHPG